MNIESLEKRLCFDAYGPTPPAGFVSQAIPLWTDSSIADQVLESKFQTYNVDGISFTEMKDVFSKSLEDGHWNRFERLQLERYVRLGSMPEYVHYLSDAVVNGNYVSDPTDTLTEVVDKWFGGKDLPTLPENYEYVEVEGELYVDGLSPTDAKQGAANDCYFITALGAISQNAPEAIQDMITEVEPDLWVVRFYDARGDAHYVSVNDELPVRRDWTGKLTDRESVFAYFGNSNDVNNELWPALLEKAYVQVCQNEFFRTCDNEYKDIAWGDSGIVFQNITNQEKIAVKGLSKQDHIDYLNQNKPITISYDNHTYTFESYDPETQKFFLRNPYQRDHIIATWEELEQIPVVGAAYGGYLFDFAQI